MLFSKIVMTSLLGFALASPVDINRRTPAQIESDITSISSQLSSFTSAINSFTGNLLQALTLLASYESLHSAIGSATSQVTSTGALGDTDSATIYTAVQGLTSEITSTLSDTSAQKSIVSSSGYTSVVCSALSTLSSDANAFFTALEGTIASTYTSQVDALQTTVASGFTGVTSTFGCT